MATGYHCMQPQLKGGSRTLNDSSNCKKKEDITPPNDDIRPTTKVKKDYNYWKVPAKRNSQLEDDCVCVDREVYHRNMHINNESIRQHLSVFLSSLNISPTTKSNTYYNNRKTPVAYNRPSERSISRGKENSRIPSPNDQLRPLQHSDTKEQTINNSNMTPQPKIYPYKRDNRQLFVGGLPAGITRDELRNFFEKFGTILDSVVILDRDTKRSRGFGFVTFEDPRVAHKLLHYNNCTKNKYQSRQPTHVTSASVSGSIFIHGKRCEIKATNPKELFQNPRNFLKGTDGIKTQNSYKAMYKTASFYKATLPINYSVYPPSYPCDLNGQMQHVKNDYQYPNGIVGHVGDDGEHYAKPFSVDSGTWPYVTMDIPPYSPVAYTAQNQQFKNSASVRIINKKIKL